MKGFARFPLVVALLAALVCLPAVGCGSKGKGYDSPQAAFDAMKAAGEKKDWKGFCECLTPDSQDAMAGMMVMGGVVSKAFGGLAAMGEGEEAEKAKAALEKIDEVLKKHGIDEEAMKSVQEKEKPESSEEQLAVLKELASPVKDKPAFIGDMMAALEGMGSGSSGMDFKGATLKDVKIDGDTATATITATDNDTTHDEPIQFKKLSGGWLIELPLDKM